jgi:RNA polymerase sigma factor (sigma-70 family)
MGATPSLEQALAHLARMRAYLRAHPEARAPTDPEALRRDREARLALYEYLYPLVIATAYREFRGLRDLVEDATQQTFVKLYKHAPFDRLEDADSLSKYAYVVAYNVCKTYMRSVLRHNASLPDSDATPPERVDNTPGPAEQAAERELRGRVEHLAADLKSEDDRRLLQMLMRGDSSADILKETSWTRSALDNRLSRLRTRLRGALGDSRAGSS